MAKHDTPSKPGFYWARWMHYYDSHTPDETGPFHEFEIVHVVVNCSDETDPEYLMVEVPGHGDWQPLEDFCWGEFVASERKA